MSTRAVGETWITGLGAKRQMLRAVCAVADFVEKSIQVMLLKV
jgi:hypothetical protein